MEKIAYQPEYDALNAFDAENRIEPVRQIACRIAMKYDCGQHHPIVDDISRALEDAYDLGVRRGPLEPKNRQPAR